MNEHEYKGPERRQGRLPNVCPLNGEFVGEIRTTLKDVKEALVQNRAEHGALMNKVDAANDAVGALALSTQEKISALSLNTEQKIGEVKVKLARWGGMVVAGLAVLEIALKFMRG